MGQRQCKVLNNGAQDVADLTVVAAVMTFPT